MVTSVRFSGPNSEHNPRRLESPKRPSLERQDAFYIPKSDEEDSFEKLPETNPLKRSLTDANGAPPPKRVKFVDEEIALPRSKRPLPADVKEENTPTKRVKQQEASSQETKAKTQTLFDLLRSDRLETQQNEEVKGLVRGRAKADVQAKEDRRGNTLLHIAARHGHADAVEILLNAKADIKAKNMHGNTPLHEAAWYGRNTVVQKIIAWNNRTEKAKHLQKADLDAKDTYGVTPLQQAAFQGHADVVEALLKARASQVGDQYGATPHYNATWQKHHKIVGLLEAHKKKQAAGTSLAAKRERY